MRTHIGRIGGRLKSGVISICGILIAAFLLKPCASAITVQVSTSKPQYYVGEVIYILVTVPEAATLHFSSSCQASYIMDQTFTPPLTCAQSSRRERHPIPGLSHIGGMVMTLASRTTALSAR